MQERKADYAAGLCTFFYCYYYSACTQWFSSPTFVLSSQRKSIVLPSRSNQAIGGGGAVLVLTYARGLGKNSTHAPEKERIAKVLVLKRGWEKTTALATRQERIGGGGGS